MTLRHAEWIAGELICLNLGALAMAWVWQGWKKHEHDDE